MKNRFFSSHISPFLKSLIYKSLSLEKYLLFLHIWFTLNYCLGILRFDSRFRYHYCVKSLINKNNIIIDIGANLGYYTKLFSKWTGPGGEVYAVEPISDFCKILAQHTKSKKNIQILPFALWAEEKKIELWIEWKYSWLPAGYMKVIEGNSEKNYHHKTWSLMKKWSQLFSELKKIDYIKIDVEWYEMYILNDLRPLILKHKPILQIESWHISELVNFLSTLEWYSCYEFDCSKKIKKIDNLLEFNSNQDIICIYQI